VKPLKIPYGGLRERFQNFPGGRMFNGADESGSAVQARVRMEPGFKRLEEYPLKIDSVNLKERPGLKTRLDSKAVRQLPGALRSWRVAGGILMLRIILAITVLSTFVPVIAVAEETPASADLTEPSVSGKTRWWFGSELIFSTWPQWTG